MGTCFSKKNTSTSSSVAAAAAAPPPPSSDLASKPKLDYENSSTSSSSSKASPPLAAEVKKEIFVIKQQPQRKSHERPRPEDIIKPKLAQSSSSSSFSSPTSSGITNSNSNVVVSGDGDMAAKSPPPPVVRTSSCTKEEVDAILIQCGRLSRSSSGKANSNSNSCQGGGGRKYSGSKRSYDFDHDNNNNSRKCTDDEQQVVAAEEDEYSRQPSHRRTPSRERDVVEYKRSGSGGRRHRSSSTSREEDRKQQQQHSTGSTSRRLSRSPGRRSETTTSSAAAAVGDKLKGASASAAAAPPAKMVSVPASTTTGGAIKRVSVKRTTASPRSQSPANPTRDNNNNAPSLSRNSSRKLEHSPYRRNPLAEIDDNCPKSEQINKKPIAGSTTNNKAQSTKEIFEEGVAAAAKKPFHFQSQKPEERNGCSSKNQKNMNAEEEAIEAKSLNRSSDGIKSPKGSTGDDNLKPPQTITRSRSSRRSRDLDYLTNDLNNPTSNVKDGDGDIVNVPTSYASLLLEDIQNFHQKNSNSSNSNTATFSLPPCVTKACSILDAVADLNSSTASNISNNVFCEERSTQQSNNNNNISGRSVSSSNAHLGKRGSEVGNKDPFVETEVFVYDDVMDAATIHKYITVRRGMGEAEEMEQQESSGSNNVVGQQWHSSSSWELNSADSTDHWTSSSNTGDEDPSAQVHKKRVYSEGVRKLKNSGNCSTHLSSSGGKKRELDQHHQVGRFGGRSSNTAPAAAAASM